MVWGVYFHLGENVWVKITSNVWVLESSGMGKRRGGGNPRLVEIRGGGVCVCVVT